MNSGNGATRRSLLFEHRFVLARFRLGDVPLCSQHIAGPDCDCAWLFEERMERKIIATTLNTTWAKRGSLISFRSSPARYAVKRDKWKNVNLEVYYNSGPRIQPRQDDGVDQGRTRLLREKLQSVPVHAVPCAGVSAIPNVCAVVSQHCSIFRGNWISSSALKDPDDIDLLYFVNAHELAHQWWGHQLIGSMTQGSNMMSESLAEYSALQGHGEKIRRRKYAQVS